MTDVCLSAMDFMGNFSLRFIMSNEVIKANKG